jgi:hypothetical protein
MKARAGERPGRNCSPFPANCKATVKWPRRPIYGSSYCIFLLPLQMNVVLATVSKISCSMDHSLSIEVLPASFYWTASRKVSPFSPPHRIEQLLGRENGRWYSFALPSGTLTPSTSLPRTRFHRSILCRRCVVPLPFIQCLNVY